MNTPSPNLATAQRGFSLLEIVVSLTIVLLILGMATLSFQTIQDEGVLQNEATALKLGARKVMRESVEKNQSFTISLGPSFFTVGPSYSITAMQDISDVAQGQAMIRGERHDLEPQVLLFVKRWNEPNFRPPAKPFEAWTFEPGGICEPLSIQLVYGNAYLRMTFNPLTAHVESEELYVP